MYELLGVSTNVPIDICSSFTRLVQRGGGAGPRRNDWDITFYEGKGCRTSKSPQPSLNSFITKLVQDYPIESYSVLTHIRQTNWGEMALENTHPFTRESWGRNWTYAHNGQLTGYRSLEAGNFRPVDGTDSEKAFYRLLHKSAQCHPHTPGSMTAIFECIASLAGELRQRGAFNMLFSDRCRVMAYCSTNLHWTVRCTPFGMATLLDQDVEVDLNSQTTSSDMVTVITT